MIYPCINDLICFLAFAQLQILIPLAGWSGQTRRVSIMEELRQDSLGETAHYRFADHIYIFM